ncbi:transcription/translation regulatory transformer protein RfaH [uncultured Thiodictyon sp.]|uniref:transcription/translation regulatory transformer protein RfaH n=1 Tax=uncultured Thiodictyon sp. TaxID=1846217 RepID=UPI0025DE2F7B|nr:transcription/translation regulatory transformer protein RfaH [uncultured Thiodictyon sp.]
MNTWSVVFSKPRQEAVARTNLERQGFTAYLPMLKRSKRLRGRWVDVVEPLFPRYLFVALEFGVHDLSPIRSTLGVIDLVRFGLEPATVPQGVVESLMAAEDPAAACHLGRTEPFHKGDRVTIAAGPFAGIEAIFEESTGKGRVLLLLDLLGQANRVQVDKNLILYKPLPGQSS